LLKHILQKEVKMIKKLYITFLIVVPILLSSVGVASATIKCSAGVIKGGYSGSAQYCCGGTENNNQPVAVSINFGCQGKGNPIEDMIFAFIKLLSDGVGIVVIASLVVAGIQFTSSRGDPQATAKSMHRVQSNVTALILFFFAYAILNYVVPGAVLQ
jgi:hypothetical protein